MNTKVRLVFLIAAILIIFSCGTKTVDARDTGVRKHAVLRTAMRGHDNGELRLPDFSPDPGTGGAPIAIRARRRYIHPVRDCA